MWKSTKPSETWVTATIWKAFQTAGLPLSEPFKTCTSFHLPCSHVKETFECQTCGNVCDSGLSHSDSFLASSGFLVLARIWGIKEVQVIYTKAPITRVWWASWFVFVLPALFKINFPLFGGITSNTQEAAVQIQQPETLLAASVWNTLPQPRVIVNLPSAEAILPRDSLNLPSDSQTCLPE